MGRYPPDEPTLRNPTSGMFGCCARTASGHATAVLLKNLMNSRRLMASPAPRTKSGIKRLSHFWIENCAVRRTQAGPQPCPLWVKSRHSTTSDQCPLYPQKRTSKLSCGMSALCQNRKSMARAHDGSEASSIRACVSSGNSEVGEKCLSAGSSTARASAKRRRF